MHGESTKVYRWCPSQLTFRGQIEKPKKKANDFLVFNGDSFTATDNMQIAMQLRPVAPLKQNLG